MVKSKSFKRFTGVALVSSAIVAGGYGVMATAPSYNVSEDVVSNDLNIIFSVAGVIKENIIALTWSTSETDNEQKSVSTKKGKEENVSIYINQGSEFEEKTIAVLLEIPTAETNKIDSITLSDGTTAATSFEVSDNTYYVIEKDIEVTENSTDLSTEFNITFSEAAINTDIDAKIFAVADERANLSNDTSISFSTGEEYFKVYAENGWIEMRGDEPDPYETRTIADFETYRITIHPNAELKYILSTDEITTEEEFKR